MRFDCPECHRPVEVEARFIGKEASCPYCESVILVPAGSGDPPAVAVPVAAEPAPEIKPDSSSRILLIALLAIGVVALILLFRIERLLASVPRVEDWYESRNEEVPFDVSKAERRAPVISVKDGVEVDNEVKVRVDNQVNDPVPVRIRE